VVLYKLQGAILFLGIRDIAQTADYCRLIWGMIGDEADISECALKNVVRSSNMVIILSKNRVIAHEIIF
jgi:hypothetical protein